MMARPRSYVDQSRDLYISLDLSLLVWYRCDRDLLSLFNAPLWSFGEPSGEEKGNEHRYVRVPPDAPFSVHPHSHVITHLHLHDHPHTTWMMVPPNVARYRPWSAISPQ